MGAALAAPGAEGLRAEILDLAARYAAATDGTPFVPGETEIPCSGKVTDADDLRQLLDASLDMWLTTGRYGARFEAELAARVGVDHARFTVSGSAANLLAFSALTSAKLGARRIAPGSEVVTVAAGFPTTVAPIVQNRCIPVFVDIERATANIDVERLAAAIGPKTRAVMLAHTLGNPFAADRVAALCRAHDLYLIEDCCDALGATLHGRPVGSFGDLATLSFYPAHHITTGEGGAVLGDDKTLIRLVESFRDWGRDCWCPPGEADSCGMRFDWRFEDLPPGYDHKYVFSHLGYNLKATDMQAALGVSQLRKLDGFIAQRRANFTALTELFEATGLTEHFELPQATPGAVPSWFGFLLTIRDGSPLVRRDVVAYLARHKIGSRPLFAGNLTRQPAFREVEYRVVGGLAETDRVMARGFWIGVWPGIDAQRRAYMAEIFTRLVHELVP